MQYAVGSKRSDGCPRRADEVRSAGGVRPRSWVPAGLLLACLGLTGCAEDVDTVYGQRKGPHWASVNGTGVFGRMFEQAGHSVYSWRSLSPRLWGRTDCIVWFPNGFKPPSQEASRWLEAWLEALPGRTLIYVGRDFDAAAAYWEKIEPLAPADQKPEIRRRRREAQNAFVTSLKAASKKQECDWFTLVGKYRRRRVRSLQGDPKWREGIDASKLEIELSHRLVPSPHALVVLASEGDALVSTRPFDRSRLILVANGSFLVNLALVNHEHRKLAGQLVDEVGPPGQTVVFLESGSGGPAIVDTDPAVGPPSGLEIFHVWPTNWILLHLSVVGIMLCLWRFPIFGRPWEPAPRGRSDFGRHIQALGELLRRSKDRAYAVGRIAHYEQTVRGESRGTRPTDAAERQESTILGAG